MNEMNLHSERENSGDSLWEIAQRHRSMVMILGIAALLAVSLIAYWTAMRGDFIWDDDHYVTANPNLRNWEGLKNIWVPPDMARERTQYYPLTNTVFWMQYHLWGLNATGYHV